MNFDLICIGMALVDSIIRGFNPEPVSASGYVAESGSLNAGGEAVNAAVAAAKLGLKTGILCALGNDAAGELVLDMLRKGGVDTRSVVRTAATPVTTMFVRQDGTRKSITNQTHRFNFHPEKDSSLFTDAKAVLLGSLFRAPFDDPAVVQGVVSSARTAGQLVFADTKIPNFKALALADLRDSLPQIDYITPNEDEARHFTGKEDPEAMADVFLEYGVKNVIIKLGGKGCLLKNRETLIRLPAQLVEAVDATGAGDNFGAGFISEILRSAPPEEALRFANACGAVCTTAVGAGTALRDREQVLRLLDGSPAKKK
jgi:sugar/nucleoside kinase (ribokinase family)